MRALTFHLIPHTHWDREWYLTRAGFQARLVPVLDEVLEQLETDSDARFVLDGQTVLLEDYLAIRPEHQARLAALAERGGLEIGPWYVLSDLLIPSAESMRRNLAEGTRDAARFGRRLDVLYSPDAFGHPAALPALAAEFGIRRAVIRRGMGRPGGVDRDLYRWESPDGSNVLVYHLPAGGYDLAIDLAEARDDLERVWAPIRDQLVERALTDQIAVFLGADHHAMVRDVAGLRARLQTLEPGHQVRVSGLTEFFEAVERALPDAPFVSGELRRIDDHAWVLQGVHSTRSRMKRRFSRAELMLARIAEPLATLSRSHGGGDRGGLLRLAWRTLLQSQFHDTLAGTTSDDVQREQDLRLDTVETLSREIATRSLRELVGPDPDRAREDPDQDAPRLVLWNPTERPRSGICTAELTFFRKDVLVGPPGGRKARRGKGYQPFVLETSAGEIHPVQVLGTRRDQERLDTMRHYPDQDEVDRVWVAFQAPKVAGLGVSELVPRLMARSAADIGLEVADGFLANRLVEVRIAPTGTIMLIDKRTGERYPGLCVLEDEPDGGDTYTFSRGAGPKLDGGSPISSRTLARGPLVGAVEARWSMRSAGRGEIGVRLVAALFADSPVLRLRFDVDNGATDHRLRVRFPIGAGDSAIAGAAFGSERRPPVPEGRHRNAIEQSVPTAPAQRYVAAGDESRGLLVLAPGFFEYEWTAKRDLVVTLLRSVGELSRANLAERPGHAGWPAATPLAQEPGSHTIELSLAPAGADEQARPERLERLWEDQFLPLQAAFLRDFAESGRDF
jgi:mannosylglycerate hydrolase